MREGKRDEVGRGMLEGKVGVPHTDTHSIAPGKNISFNNVKTY